MIKLLLLLTLITSIKSIYPRAIIENKEEKSLVHLINNTRDFRGRNKLRYNYELSTLCYFNNKQQRATGLGIYISKHQDSTFVFKDLMFAHSVFMEISVNIYDPKYTKIGLHFDGFYWTLILE